MHHRHPLSLHVQDPFTFGLLRILEEHMQFAPEK